MTEEKEIVKESIEIEVNCSLNSGNGNVSEFRDIDNAMNGLDTGGSSDDNDVSTKPSKMSKVF